MKAGFYNTAATRRRTPAPAGWRTWVPGLRHFGNNTNNAARHRLRLRQRRSRRVLEYLQQIKLIEGSMIYNNTEFYVQDNWKVNSRLTLDYGLRFTHQQPQHDQFLQMSNFFPDSGRRRGAAALRAGMQQRRDGCSGNTRNAMNPLTGQILTATARRTARRHRHGRPGHRQPDQRHPPGRRRHRQARLHLAEARARRRASAPPTTCSAPRS